jgi:tripartite-type tricarboxylate transporter receptor subunit TctC
MFSSRNHPRRRVFRLSKGAAAVLALTAPFVLAACGGDNAGDGGEPTDVGVVEAWEPKKDIEWIVPFSAGGGFDAYSRGLAEAAESYIPDGVNVVVSNIEPMPQGLTSLFTAKPDGYTIGLLPMPSAVGEEILQPDIVKWKTDEFTVFGQVDSNAYVVYVAGDSPYETIDDLVNASEKLQAATVSKGGSSGLATRAAIAGLGLDAGVTYGLEGSAEVVTTLLRGDADFIVYGTSDIPGFVESGDVRPLLFLGTEDQRPEELTWLQEVPSAEDAGYPDLAGTVTEIRAVVGPPDMPEEIANYWRTKLQEILASDEFKKWSEDSNRPIVPLGAKEAEKAIDTQIERMKILVPQLPA